MQHQHLSGAGATFLLEQKLSRYYGKKFALAFSNATTALQAVCLALELHRTEILTSPINWGGSVAPFLLHGNKLRFTSFDAGSLHLSVNDLPLAVTSKTKAVLSVDYHGTSVNSKAIKDFCTKHGLYYISDSAQSLGAYHHTKPAGFFADLVVLSFSPGKSLFAGEGGAIVTDDEAIYEKLLWYSQHPSRQKAVLGLSHYNAYAPLNGRMNPLSAILLNYTFDDSLIDLKKHQGKCFEVLQQLQQENLIDETPHLPSLDSSTFFNYSLQLKPSVGLKRVNEFLKDKKQELMATPSLLELIPFDNSFRKQFSRRFSCSENLLKQKSSVLFNDLITLNATS
ncbi:MAG: DegT/DnrJ/EryC1/StrS family aminotransferase [Spirosomataceae bacterium]